MEHQNEAFKKLLVIDTSTSVMSIALMDGEHLLRESNETVDRSHSNKLIPAIHDLISSQGISMQDIDGIAVGRGPGSYTGVRIGVTAAKTLAWSLRIPLIAVSSLEALAYGALNKKIDHDKQWIIPIMDARRSQVYTGLYAADQQHWSCSIMDRIQLIEDWIGQLAAHGEALDDKQQPHEIYMVGETVGIRENAKGLHDRWPGKVHISETKMRAFHLGELAQQRWMKGEQEEVHHLVPNYTQLAEAEANLLAKQKQGE